MVAGIPRMAADRATAWAWLPEEKATTPARRWSGSNRESALNAPRNLNAPIRWRFSHLKNTEAPTSASTRREVSTGVRCAWPRIRSAARSTSA
jgi:hypothetical protein